MNHDPNLTLCTKNFTDLNVKHKTIKLIVKSIEENLCSLGLDRALRLDTKSMIYKRKIL